MARLTGGAGGGAARRDDPLAFLRAEFDASHHAGHAGGGGGGGGGGDVWRSASGRFCVAGPEAAREVMGNRRGAFVETSDFFHTRAGVLGPRAAQLETGRAARQLLGRQLDARRPDLPRLVRERLAPESTWPDAGNLLVREHLRDVLLSPDAPAEVHEAVDGIVTRAVLAGARERHSVLSRLRFRRWATGVLVREVRARRRAGVTEPRDLLDVAVAGAGAAAEYGEVAEVYLSFLFATVGSIGFALGWSVRLAGTHPDTLGDEPGWIVREALRLWPVAWLFARTPSRAHELDGVAVGPRDAVDVCLYLVHRHPRHWADSDAFLPRRWAEPRHDPAFLPFGFGPHTCAGAGLTMTLLEDLVRVLTRDWRLTVTEGGGRPLCGPALAPPRFTAELHDRGATGRDHGTAGSNRGAPGRGGE